MSADAVQSANYEDGHKVDLLAGRQRGPPSSLLAYRLRRLLAKLTSHISRVGVDEYQSIGGSSYDTMSTLRSRPRLHVKLTHNLTSHVHIESIASFKYNINIYSFSYSSSPSSGSVARPSSTIFCSSSSAFCSLSFSSSSIFTCSSRIFFSSSRSFLSFSYGFQAPEECQCSGNGWIQRRRASLVSIHRKKTH